MTSNINGETSDDEGVIPELKGFPPYTAIIMGKIEELAQLITKTFLNSRERSIAIMKLEEAELWLTKCEEVSPVEYPDVEKGRSWPV